MTHLREQYFAIQAADPQHAVIGGNGMTITWRTAGAQGRGFIVLPPGTWQIVCTSNATTPEQLHEVVERDSDGFKDYDKDRFHNDIPFASPMDSLNSLLTSKGCDLKLNYLILKKVG